MATDSGAATPAPSAADLKRTVDHIEQHVREIRATQSAIRRQGIVAVLLVLVLVGVFAFVTYRVMRDNLSGDKVEAALRMRADQIARQMTPRFAAALREVQPVYVDLAKERLAKVAPEIQQSFVEEATRLPADIQTELEGDLRASVGRIESRLRTDLKQHFPKLTEAQLKNIGGRMEEELRKEGEGLKNHLQDLMRQEMERLLTSLDAFPLPDVREAPAEDVQKIFLHHLLMLVDHELLVSGTDEALHNPEIEVLPAIGNEGLSSSDEGVAPGAAPSRAERGPARTRGTATTQPAGSTDRPDAGSR